ncbi:unnamed protein product [Spirodela intermedia]|uniref:Uncharacterized protein n=1 Tax=Spirodela intermedia TaxID=51605 RepID=A0A7I8IFG8_SPIIN|nr:unnamed protein product [Spirodela intermedia]CAA6656546.1 unnamed protein product [Spirodela intermedia]
MPIASGGEDAVGPAATPRVLVALTVALERLVARNDELAAALEEERRRRTKPAARGALDVFRAARVPSISVGRYLERLYQYSDCSPSCFVVGFAYMDRLAHRHPSSLLLSVNVHRLLLASLLVASKVLDDAPQQRVLRESGGVSTAELNRLELELLFLLDFGVTVGARAFEGYCLHLEKELLCNSGGGGERRRGSGGRDGVGRGLTPPSNGAAGEESDTPWSRFSSPSPPNSF